MASSSSKGGGSSPSLWRNVGASGENGGMDRVQQHTPMMGSTNPPLVPPHAHHRDRKRDREKNHETVCNLLSMLTIEEPQQQQPNHQQLLQRYEKDGSSSNNEGQATAQSSSSSTSSVDNKGLLLISIANTPESCRSLRAAGCIPLLIELIHPTQRSSHGIQTPEIIRVRAARALKNIVQFNPDEKTKRNEMKVLKILEGIRLFSETVKGLVKNKKQASKDGKDTQIGSLQHPASGITVLMKLSFDEEHRKIMCLLGSVHAIADLVVSDHLIHGNCSSDLKQECLLLRRYSVMILTNLTFNDGTNKILLCGMREFLSCLVVQLECDNEDICQVTASVLRNLSWKSDSSSQASLCESNAVSKLILAAMKTTKESTLKATLSALWNLSGHSDSSATNNNADAICSASSNSLPFLISLMRPNNPVMKQMKTPMTIIENAGGILRNISPHLKRSSELRKILRENHCFEILLEHLKSSSLCVVSNACSVLCTLSGGTDCEEDQRKLLDQNAIPMLKSLVYSKHDRISKNAGSALRNLLQSKFAKDHTIHLDSRLSAQIYSQGSSENGNYKNTQKSPNLELEMEINSGYHYPHPQLQQQEPPAAHQHSSVAAASLFQRPAFFNSHKPVPVHFHNHPPPQPHPSSTSGFRNSRPSTINYSMDCEPLDLTMASAKSSPIHVISAAEFGNHSMQHQRIHGGSANIESGFYRPQSQNQNHYFLNAPNLIHHSESVSHSSGSMIKYSFPKAKFNQSCPEILSRFQQNLTPTTQNLQESTTTKPLDYSSTSGSTTSSNRGGAGEAVGISNDSNGGGEGDTTFNYSLRFTEVESHDDAGNPHPVSSNVKSEDTVKTYCYEGTPHNFSISNSCQDLIQELEYEKESAAAAANNNDDGKPHNSKLLQPIDEIPRAYYVENTPAVFSRTSSLSSINSSDELNAGENRAEVEYGESSSGQSINSTVNNKSSLQETCTHMPPQPLPRKRNFPNNNNNNNNNNLQSHTPSRVTFSAEETPLMFSRCSSVASLDSLDVGVSGGGTEAATKNDEDLSDYSRRASEVGSPSDLPDSPRALAPPIRVYEQPQQVEHVRRGDQKKQEDEVKVFSISMEEKSGLNSCRSLSPLTVDGEELPIIGKGKLDCVKETDASNSTAIDTNSTSKLQVPPPSSSPAAGSLSGSNIVIQNDNRRNKTGIPDDELKVFAMEGTPFYGVSNATSLSDLMMDIEESSDPTTRIDVMVNTTSQSKDTLLCIEKSAVDQVQSDNKASQSQSCAAITSENTASQNNKDEPTYSDAQLLEKCIRVGKALGIPKSQSEFRIGGDGCKLLSLKGDSTSEKNKLEKKESKSQDFEFDDPDLAALILIGRNRSKEKDKSFIKGKTNKKSDKDNIKSSKSATQPKLIEINNVSSTDSSNVENSTKINEDSIPFISTNTTTTLKSSSENSTLMQDDNNKDNNKQTTTKNSTEENVVKREIPQSPNTNSSIFIRPQQHQLIQETGPPLDPNQVSTISLGSEWNDETPTFSSPIPSMSISTAFKLAGSICGDSSMSKPPIPAKTEKEKSQKQKINNNMNASTVSLSLQNELLENIDPPSTFSNIVSSSDCVLLQSPQLHHRSQTSNLSDKLNKKWKALNEATNACSTHSNLSGQKPPIDFDLENSMISVASIKSEIYELSSTSFNNEIFESAVEDLGEFGTGRPAGDTSIGGNTYTIFPPENANRLTGAKSTDLSDGGNTIVSEDFTDAEDIEDFETAPVDDMIEDLNVKPEKSDREKVIMMGTTNIELNHIEGLQNSNDDQYLPSIQPPSGITTHHPVKPRMEVAPYPLETTNKYNTFVVKKSPMSPRASPRQKRREDPDRYRTRTINPVSTGKFMSDANGNPELKFATFRVGGPKIIKPSTPMSNLNILESDTSVSPESTPGHSPKGIRGRRKPLYSSLPPSAIIRKKTTPPPVPPKPNRAASPARSTTSSTGGGVYVRPTRTTELRIAANNSRDHSPRRGDGNSSKNSSNSSLNIIHQSSRYSDTGIPVASSRPKVAPKPPVRTTPATIATSNSVVVVPRGFVGSTSSMQIKTSNSSFGFGQQVKIGEKVANTNMKGYSTLPKSSKFGTEDLFSTADTAESRESISGSEKSIRSGMGKITNLWRKMDFRNNHKDSTNHTSSKNTERSQIPEKKSSTSKFSNIFGRNKNKEKSTPKPFREPLPTPQSTTGPNFANDSTFASTGGGVWVKRDGDNKVLVQPFNYTPPIQKPTVQSEKKEQEAINTNTTGVGIVQPMIIGTEVSNNSISSVPAFSNPQSTSASAAGSAKITTV